MENEENLIPGNGVYAVDVEIRDAGKKQSPVIYKGMMNIGNRPTVDGTKKTIEVNIFDFDKDIYGATLRVYVKKYIRSEQKFDGLEALKSQLAKDREVAMAE